MQVSKNLADRSILTFDSSYELALLYFTEITKVGDLSYRAFLRNRDRLVNNFELITNSKFTTYKTLESCSRRLDEVNNLKMLINSKFKD